MSAFDRFLVSEVTLFAAPMLVATLATVLGVWFIRRRKS